LAQMDPSEALAHADGLYNFARWLSGEPAGAEDLVQETYARAFAAAHQFESGSNLRAWLFRILRNAFLDRRRRGALDSAEELEDDALPKSGPADELGQEQIRRLVAEDVAKAVGALSEPFRSVVLLDMEGFTESECAHVLGCAEGTVKSRLSRARAQLRASLAGYRP
jgi:RNA polymerase sigma-70 factor (ECF subfamily)